MKNVLLATIVGLSYFLTYYVGRLTKSNEVEKQKNDDIQTGLQIKQSIHSRDFDATNDPNNRDNAK